MASFLDEHELVFEIGTGTGEGTKALLEKGHTVISIDENPSCLKVAYKKLSTESHKVLYEKREKISINETGYRIEYSYPETNPIKEGALLSEGDVVNDPTLEEWLSADVGPLDAVVCWLIGTNSARFMNNKIQPFRIKNSMEYRFRVQNKIYELADKILRPGGVLHVVDRGEEPKEEFLKEDCLNSHREQAETTTLSVESLYYRRYEEPAGDAKVQMVDSPVKSGRDPGDVQRAFISVISRKP